MGLADPGEGGTGTPGAAGGAGGAALSAADVKAMAEEMIKNSRGKIDSANGEQVAWKILSIIKAAQPQGSCSLFTPYYLSTSANTTAAEAGKFTSYETTDARYSDGTGTFTVKDTSAAASVTVTTGFLAANAKFKYEFDKYSIDGGNYFLSGNFEMKQAAISTATAHSKLKMEAAKDGSNILTLSKNVVAADGTTSVVAIGKLTFDDGFEHAVVSSPTSAKATNLQCGSLVGWPAASSKVSVEAIAPVKFTKIDMAITTLLEAHAGAAATGSGVGSGKNLDMLAFLVGPKGNIKVPVA